jgi:hypothetical protein
MHIAWHKIGKSAQITITGRIIDMYSTKHTNIPVLRLLHFSSEANRIRIWWIFTNCNGNSDSVRNWKPICPYSVDSKYFITIACISCTAVGMSMSVSDVNENVPFNLAPAFSSSLLSVFHFIYFHSLSSTKHNCIWTSNMSNYRVYARAIHICSMSNNTILRIYLLFIHCDRY